MTRNQESQLQSLLLVQPRITISRIVQTQIVLVEAFAATQALRYRIARKFQMNAAEGGTMLFVDFESGREFREDAAEMAGLDPGWCAAGVS